MTHRKSFKIHSQFCEYIEKIFVFLQPLMIVTFDKDYLRELYVNGRSTSKKHRFQPDIVSRYIKVVNIMKDANNVLELYRFKGLKYEQLQGDKNGFSSVRVNDKYRIEFTESTVENQHVATICNITELSNHYQ